MSKLTLLLLSSIALLVIGGVSVAVGSTLLQTKSDSYYYIGEWKRSEDINKPGFIYWEPSQPNKQWIDLRSLGQAASQSPVGTVTCCLIAVSNTEIIDPQWILLGTSPDDLLPSGLARIETKLGLIPNSLTSTTVGDLMYELLVDTASPTQLRYPILPNKNQVFTLELDGKRMFNKPVDYQGTGWQKVRQTIQIEYTKLRTESLKNGDQLYLKWLEVQARIYRVPYTEFLGSNPDEGTVKPSTTISDDFDCSDADSPDCDLDWTELTGDWDIVSNELRYTGAGFADIRAESDLSSSDMISEFDCVALPLNKWCGVTARESSSTNTYYLAFNENQTNGIRMYYVISGSFTLIATQGGNNCAGDPCATQKVGIGVEGSTITGYIDDVDVVNTTNSTITSGLRCGLWGYDSEAHFDNFNCYDLGGGGSARRRLITGDDAS